jgi:pSer/pThr/pTyr-binding forkhead associated (FHA) protein
MLPPISLPSGVADRVIGRSDDCDLVVRDPSVSREHAALHRRRDGWYVADLESTNGTFVNGWRVSAPVPVSVGDVLTVGATSFQIVTTVLRVGRTPSEG